MSVLSTSVTVLCCSLFTASLIKLISPSGKTEKILKLVISLFVLICLTTCIKNVIKEAEIFNHQNLSVLNDSEKINQTIDENVLKVTGDYMVVYIENLLAAENIDYKEITATVDAAENGVINITDICIYMDKDKTDSDKARSTIENDLKITPRFILKE